MDEDYISLKPSKPAAFVGGAEKARRNARKRMHQPRSSNNSNSTNSNNSAKNKRRYNNNGHNDSIITSPYPKSMREYERFFGSLLSSSTDAMKKSESDGASHQKVMQQACSLLNVPSIPTPPSLQQKLVVPSSNVAVRSHHLMQRSSSLLSNASSTTTNSSSYSSSSSGSFDNARSYYSSKAPLILEESRCIIASELVKLSYNNNKNKRSSSSSGSSTFFTLELTSIEEKYPKLATRSSSSSQYAPLILNFDITNNEPFKKQKIFSSSGSSNNSESNTKWKRPGSVLLLSQKHAANAAVSQGNTTTNNGNGNGGDGVLACVVPNGNWQSSSKNSLSLMIFRRDDLDVTKLQQQPSSSSVVFHATAITTLISQVRQTEACLRMVKVSFMNKLLGRKSSTHIRFDNSDDDDDGSSSSDDEEEVVEEMVEDDYRIGPKLLQEGFYVGDNSCCSDDDNNSATTQDDEKEYKSGNSLKGLLIKIPKLNTTQERAAKDFLESPKESLILVQGPPGTGKSTFLVNIICRRLATNPNCRLLVTAPTNKAVTVLAERFLSVVTNNNGGVGGGGGNDLLCKCNAVLVGVEDKLITTKNDNLSSSSSSSSAAAAAGSPPLPSSLQNIFVYTWIESLKEECVSLLACLKSLHRAKQMKVLDNMNEKNGQQQQCEVVVTVIDTLVARAERIKTKLIMSIPHSARSACSYARSLHHQLKAVAAAEELWEEDTAQPNNEDEYDLQISISASTSSQLIEDAITHAKGLVDALSEMESSPPVQELLMTARVIFCTLSTAGSSILKQTRRIDDLLIDEAAAATEPEICIPFHLRPQRMLAVGDPLQLPPTIMSRHAANMGLSTSMHERLMNQCGIKDSVMLDHQYRMKKEISHFPCNQFYSGKIMNGKNVACKTYTSDIAFSTMSPYSFIHIRGEESQMQPGGSYANQAECVAIIQLVQKIAARKVSGWDSSDKLRIITFYQGQVNLLQRLLAKKGLGKVLVATVDSSQGCEADVVIISFVRSSSKKGVRHAAGFLADDRRINVALTRARHQLICVGDAHGTIGEQGSEALKNLVSDAKRRGCLI